MARKVTISAVQLPIRKAEKEPREQKKQNVKDATKWLTEAGKRKSDIACLGEYFTTRGIKIDKNNIRDFAEPLDGPVAKRISSLARRFKMYIIAPMITKTKRDCRNSSLIFDRNGALLGLYYKAHLTRGERKMMTPGGRLPVFKLDFGRIGIAVCHDFSFVESCRVLTLKGGEIIFFPHVQSGWGDRIWDITLKSRALDNGVYIVVACYGVEPGVAWMPGMMQGRSGIYGPDGTGLSEMGRQVGVATATIDLDQPRMIRSFSRPGPRPFKKDMFADRRPELYRIISRK